MTTIDRWLTAERAGDRAALTALLADDFRAIGPRGFVLDRDGWVGRHAPGGLSYTRLELGDRETRHAGPVEITIAVQELEGEYDGRPLDERLRTTIVCDGDRVRHLQMSPIAGPPGADGG